ncbi:MAG: prepilin-type N-terminal cleavage/methylation domain-containing protein [Planctomycetes bacterium]|nr:prepilin-type N-terminal cleavage/methylation domain-containing protein [Planctomycetota bacterium]
MRKRAFTLIELLVVVSIIALLIAILLPALAKARVEAKRILCGTQQKQIVTAAFVYTNDYHGMLPSRGNLGTGGTLPHVTTGTADMNKTFYKPYLGVRIVTTGGTHREDDELLFCPGELIQVRYPGLASPDYRYSFITYQYFVQSDRGATLWRHKRNGQIYQPDLSSLQGMPPGHWALYSCITISFSPSSTTTWLGHDSANWREAPTGQNAAFFDGSVAWVPKSDLEVYWYDAPSGQQWYWPLPHD